jgi:RNA polymerase sigma-70 factor, ECF subfamily
LVRRARERDEAAIRSIMQSNNRRLYRLARGILRNDSEAEDVVQETYVRAFTHLQDFRGDSSFATWLGRIAINEAGNARGADYPVSPLGRIRGPGKIHGTA